MTAKTSGRSLPLILMAIAACVTPALAQTLPWPGDAPGNGQRAWPGEAPAARPGAAPMAAPAGPAPMMPAPRQQPNQDCVTQFQALRDARDKLFDAAQKTGAALKANTATREDLCKAITSLVVAEGKWVKFLVDKGASCGIPAEATTAVRKGHANTQTARKNICSAGPAGGRPAAPSLSDALGTTRVPNPSNTQSGRGTFDTLTGNAIVR